MFIQRFSHVSQTWFHSRIDTGQMMLRRRRPGKRDFFFFIWLLSEMCMYNSEPYFSLFIGSILAVFIVELLKSLYLIFSAFFNTLTFKWFQSSMIAGINIFEQTVEVRNINTLKQNRTISASLFIRGSIKKRRKCGCLSYIFQLSHN